MFTSSKDVVATLKFYDFFLKPVDSTFGSFYSDSFFGIYGEGLNCILSPFSGDFILKISSIVLIRSLLLS